MRTPNSYTSEVLYHLVGHQHPLDDDSNLATLRAILASMELRTSRVGEYSGGKALSIDPRRGWVDGEPIAQTVVCFCDIPFKALSLHASKYGRFGVGVDRATVAEWGGRPVMYIPKVLRPSLPAINLFSERVLMVWNGLDRFFPALPGSTTRIVGAFPRSQIEAVDMAQDELAQMLAFIKVFDIDLPTDDQENYYMEREWRKFGTLQLRPALREIVAPPEHIEALRNEFPQVRELPFRSIR